MAGEGGASIETIILVHGTFSNSVGSEQSAWWAPGSNFCSELDKAAGVLGLEARCWRHLYLPTGYSQEKPVFSMFPSEPEIDILETARQSVLESPTSPFSWTGGNSESERRAGADLLREYLTKIEGDSRIAKYHVVAHSHGGNVVRRAIREMRNKESKLGAAIFLGTPFLNYNDEGKLRNTLRRISWPILFTTVALVFFSVRYHSALFQGMLNNPQAIPLFLLLFVFLIIFLIAHYESIGPIRHVEALNIVFSADEAIGLLKKCATMALDPHILMHALYRDGPEQKPGRKEHLLSSISRVRLAGRILEAITAFGYFTFFEPYRPHFRLFFASRIPGLKQSFFGFMIPGADRPNDNVFLALYWSGRLVAASYLLLLPFEVLFGFVDWMFQVMSRFFIWVAVRSAAKAAFGIDILGSAFRLDAVAANPKATSEFILPDDIQSDALTNLPSLHPLRLSVKEAMESSDLIASVNAVKVALQDSGLLHSQYYKNRQVIRLIAQALRDSTDRRGFSSLDI